MFTFDRRSIDSSGAFLVGELERLDQTMHEPLVAVTWGRDIDLREDVTIGDDVSSFTNSTFAAPGGIVPNGKNWIGKTTTAIPGPSVDIGKTANPLNLWGMELKYSIPELQSAIQLGRPVDQQKYKGMRLKYQMDVDESVYIGDATLGYFGLCNSTLVTPSTVAANGIGNATQWTTKTPTQILADINTFLEAVWAAAGWAVIPDRLLLPPQQYGYLVSQLISQAGGDSILNFVLKNNLAAQNGRPLKIYPLKWLIGLGAGGTPGVLGTVDRMVAYTKDVDRVRYPLTGLMRTPIQYNSIYHVTTYFGKLGQMEFPYPETIGYADGI